MMNNEEIVKLLKLMIDENKETSRIITEEVEFIMKGRKNKQSPKDMYENAKKLGVLNSRIQFHKGATLALSEVLNRIENV